MRSPRALFPILLAGAWVAAAFGQPPFFPQMDVHRGRDCAVCHLMWVDAFDDPNAVLLIERPAEMVAAEELTCLGCHDGSVADDRRRVWREHGHMTGVRPSHDMTVPEELPLKDGLLHCRTCHTAHAGVGPETLATTFFMRVPHETGELCMMCHENYAGGPEKGTHPLGAMPFVLPDALQRAGAHAGLDNQTITCTSCHTPHGAREEHLLVMATETSALCLRCHEQLRPESWLPEALTKHHPLDIPLRDEIHRRAVEQMGTQTGPDGRMICLSCHQMHRGHAGSHMLADTPREARLCLRCHPKQKTVLDTRHNLLHTAPEERNQLGETAAVGGPCSACHASHRDARVARPTEADRLGQCTTCHAPGECAEHVSFAVQSHPMEASKTAFPPEPTLLLGMDPHRTEERQLSCRTCHEPHANPHGNFLVAAPDALCGACHPGQRDSLAGAHDMTRLPQAVNAKMRSAAQAGQCGFCHAVHDALGPAMWAATPQRPTHPDHHCTHCHKQGSVAAHVPAHDLRHPSGPPTAGLVKEPAMWPPFNEKLQPDPDGFIVCGTCHDVHGDSSRLHDLLRTTDRQDTTAACLSCHPDKRTIMTSLHAPAYMEPYEQRDVGGSAPYCLPCHVVHAAPEVHAIGTWAGPLSERDLPLDMRKCLGCHDGTGPAPSVRVTVHPATPVRSLARPEEPGFMPLIDAHGRESMEGRISCRTCHRPHGREPSLGLPPMDPERMSHREIQALDTMLRPFLVPNLCSSCHGFEGLSHFLYYHYPEKRARVTGRTPIFQHMGQVP